MIGLEERMELLVMRLDQEGQYVDASIVQAALDRIRPPEIAKGRRKIADIAYQKGEDIFAREVMAGCWDHRSDVKAAIRAARKG